MEFLESNIALGFISDATDYKTITDDQVRSFLEGRRQASKTTVTLEPLDNIVTDKLRTDMKNNNATARMQDVFTSFQQQFLPVHNALKWINEDKPRVAVQHVLSAIRPQSLHDPLEADQSFAKSELRRAFKGFLKHPIRLAEEFQIVDSGPTPCTPNDNNNSNLNQNGGGRCWRSRGGRGRGAGGGNNDGGGNPKRTDTETQDENLPLCLWEAHRRNGLRHLPKHFRECPREENKTLYAQLEEDKARDGPGKNTQSQTHATKTHTAANATQSSPP